MKRCPYCREQNSDTAVKCRVCGEWLEKPPATEDHDRLSEKRAALPEIRYEHVAPEETKSPSKDAQETAPRIEVDKVYREAVSRLEEVFAAGGEVQEMDVEDISPLIRQMMESLQKEDRLLSSVMQGRHTPTSLERHSVNVAVVALKIGMKLGYDQEQLMALGLASLLHDIGRATMSGSVWVKSTPLSREDWDGLHRHPKAGADVLRGIVSSELSWLPEVVLQHHERMDGSGYPSSLRGDQVHEMAYITGLADTYEAMTHHRPYRDGLSTSRALQEMKRRHRREFPGRILQALEKAIPVDFSG